MAGGEGTVACVDGNRRCEKYNQPKSLSLFLDRVFAPSVSTMIHSADAVVCCLRYSHFKALTITCGTQERIKVKNELLKRYEKKRSSRVREGDGECKCAIDVQVRGKAGVPYSPKAGPA